MALFMTAYLVLPITLPSGKASRTTLGVHETVKSCPDDKFILIDSGWEAGSRAENEAQLACVVEHICSLGKRFVVTGLGVPAVAPKFAMDVIEPIAEEAGYIYGEDWVHAGYVPAGPPIGIMIDGMCRDFGSPFKTEYRGKNHDEIPILQHISSIDDFHMVYCISYGPPEQWISFVNGQYGTPVAFGCMTIMCPQYYMYFKSGQLCGMLIGNSGASEYEKLIDSPGIGTDLMVPASFANCLIILAAIVGNIGLWAAGRKRKHG
jgi:hypothetical protein